MMYVSQIIMLHTLNLYSALSQLYLNTIRRKENKLKNKCSKNLFTTSFAGFNLLVYIL